MRVRGGYGLGSLSLRRSKHRSVWEYRFRDYNKGAKPVCRSIRIGTLEELPTKEAAEKAAEPLRYYAAGGSLAKLVRERLFPEKKIYPSFSRVWFKNKLKEQDRRCAICGKMPKRLVVDHDHCDGTLRGLLCPTCNTGIGMLDDDIAIVKRAMLYLESYEMREKIEKGEQAKG